MDSSTPRGINEWIILVFSICDPSIAHLRCRRQLQAMTPFLLHQLNKVAIWIQVHL